MSKDPFGNKKQITLYLPAELKAKLEQEALPIERLLSFADFSIVAKSSLSMRKVKRLSSSLVNLSAIINLQY